MIEFKDNKEEDVNSEFIRTGGNNLCCTDKKWSISFILWVLLQTYKY